jgi:hypothetical protein
MENLFGEKTTGLVLLLINNFQTVLGVVDVAALECMPERAVLALMRAMRLAAMILHIPFVVMKS